MEELKEKNKKNNFDTFKRIIILSFLAMFLLPILFCMYLLIRVDNMEKKLDEINDTLSSMGKDVGKMDDEQINKEDLENLDKAAYDSLEINTSKPNEYLAAPDIEREEDYDIEKEGYIETVDTPRRVYLTFDDGPSTNTDEILEILADNDVKATFFVCYTPDEDLWPMYNRIVEEGHTLGMHSYSHIYNKVYANKTSFIEDVSMLHDFLLEQTGVDSKYYRFPGGSSNTVSSINMQELISYLYSQGIEYYDWNALSGDAVEREVSPYELNMNVLTYVRENKGDSMVLMHDINVIPQTVQGLDSLIKQLKEEGFEFAAIEEDTKPVHHVKYKGNDK